MRQSTFIMDLQAQFPITGNEPVARIFADAMEGTCGNGTSSFTYDGQLYKMTAMWKDGCIKGDCNPATCYTDWQLELVKEDS